MIARGRGRKPTYEAQARERVVAEVQRQPARETDQTATWSLKLLERALRKEALPHIGATTIGHILHDIGQLLYGQPFHIPAQFAFTGRAIGTLMGVATGLAPEFNFIEVATPYARTFLRLDARRMEQTVQQLFSQLLNTGRALLTLPYALEQVLTKLEAGQIEVNLASNRSSGWVGSRGRRSGRDNSEASAVFGFTWLFMFAASLIGGIFLLTSTHQLSAGWFCFALAGLSMLRVLVKS